MFDVSRQSRRMLISYVTFATHLSLAGRGYDRDDKRDLSPRAEAILLPMLRVWPVALCTSTSWAVSSVDASVLGGLRSARPC